MIPKGRRKIILIHWLVSSIFPLLRIPSSLPSRLDDALRCAAATTGVVIGLVLFLTACDDFGS